MDTSVFDLLEADGGAKAEVTPASA